MERRGLAPEDHAGPAAELAERLERLDTGLISLIASLMRGGSPQVAHLLDGVAAWRLAVSRAPRPATDWVESHDGGSLLGQVRAAATTAALARLAPLSPAERLQERLFGPYPSVVLVSAPLAVGGSFEYLAHRLGLLPDRYGAAVVDSPSVEGAGASLCGG